MTQAQTTKRLQQEEDILSLLKRCDYLTRSQIQKLCGINGDRNARRIMQNLSPYVSSFRNETGENVFYLNRSGRERVACEIVRQKTNQVGHFLIRNDAYIHYAGAEDWKNEIKFSVQNVVTIVSDAYFRYNQRRHFLEVDHLQHMTKNREKIERYKKLRETGVFEQKLKYFPRLVWITMTENRRKQLAEWCEGLDVVIHTWDEIR